MIMNSNDSRLLKRTRGQLAAALSVALIATSFATLSARAEWAPEASENYSSAAKFESDLSINTIRDAKGNRIRLMTKADGAAAAPDLWAHKDLADDGVPGTSSRA